jgi:hypothetical protein
MFPKKMAQALWKFYCLIWYHVDGLFTENKYLRRPFTYTLRDFIHFKPHFAWPLVAGLSYGAYWLGRVQLAAGITVAIFWGLLLGHLIWSTYKPGEQENPPYVEPNSIGTMTQTSRQVNKEDA